MSILLPNEILAAGTLVRLNGGFKAEVVSYEDAANGCAVVHTFKTLEKLIRKNGTNWVWVKIDSPKNVRVSYTSVLEIYKEVI